MNRTNIFVIVLAAAVSGSFSAAASHIGFMMPSGGRQGSTVEIIIGGQGFSSTNTAYISGEGVTVEKVEFVRGGLPNPDSKQRRYYMQLLKQFHAGKKITVKMPESTEGWRKHPFYERLTELTPCERDVLYHAWFVPRNSLQASPSIAGRTIVTLKIAENAPVGEREFRLVDRNGALSNPLKFFVGKAPEIREDYFPFPPATKKIPQFTVPAVLNGQIMPGETDRFTFEAKKNEVITFKLLGRYFNPFIGDGVPGHFQAVLEIFDADKKSVAYADDYYFDPDPVLTFTAPADGTYTLHIRDALYRGREDFVYRVNVFKGKYKPPVPVPPQFKNLPVQDMGKLQIKGAVPWPVMIKHTLNTPAGNNYHFKFKKDEEAVLEVFARRLGLPPDSVIKVYDPNGKLILHNDDVARIKAGTILHNAADSRLFFTAAADGVYTVNVSDTAGAFGNDYQYFLRVDRKRKFFNVYSVPSSLRLEDSGVNPVTLIADRHDNYQGPIKLKVISPRHCRIIGSDIIPAGCDRTAITITAVASKQRPIEELVIEASAEDFKTSVIPGNEAMQAFAYTHINPAQKFLCRVMWRNSVFRWDKLKSHTLRLSNRPVTLTAKLVNYVPAGVELKIQPVDLPDWLKVVSNPGAKTKLVKINKKRPRLEVPPLKITLQTVGNAAGKKANVIFKVTWKTQSKPDKNGKVRTYAQQSILPALYIEGEK